MDATNIKYLTNRIELIRKNNGKIPKQMLDEMIVPDKMEKILSEIPEERQKELENLSDEEMDNMINEALNDTFFNKI